MTGLTIAMETRVSALFHSGLGSLREHVTLCELVIRFSVGSWAGKHSNFPFVRLNLGC